MDPILAAEMTTSCPPPNISFSDEILLIILSMLPLHALLRFKKVSKGFCRLTTEAYWLRPKTTTSSSSSPAFIVHNDRAGRSNVMHLGGSSSSSNDTAIVTADDALLPPSEDPKHHLLLATCNGLLLYKDMTADVDTAASFQRNRRHFYRVSNPVAQQWFRLPPVSSLGRIVCISFDPKISPHFRVVQAYLSGGTLLMLNVYDSQSKTWCKVDSDLMSRSVQQVRSCVLVDDVLYADMCHDDGLSMVWRADLRERSCVPIKLPGAFYGSYNMPPLASLCKCKWGRVHYLERGMEGLRLWVLQEEEEVGDEDGSRWIQMFTCTYASLNQEIRKQLPGLHSDSERQRLYRCMADGCMPVEFLDFVPCSDTTDFLLTPDRTVFVPVLFGMYRTAVAHYDFRTETVSEVIVINALVDRIFTF